MGTQITALQEVTKNLTLMEDDFKSVLPPDIDPKKFMAVVITAIQNKPDLLENDRPSLFNACRECAADGLVPDGREAALVPYKGKIKYMPMAAGLIKKLDEAGVSVNAQVVHKNDKFKFWTDEKGQHIEHEPDVFGERGDVVGAYCIAVYNAGTTRRIEVMSKKEIEKIREQSKMPNSLMWVSFWGEGAKKTVLRRTYKWLPKTPKLEAFIKKDDEDNFDFQEEQTTAAAPETSSRLADAVKDKAPEVPAEEAQFSETTTKNTGEPAIYGEMVEGPITDLKVAPDAKRFGCVVGGVIYSTTDAKMYRIMEEAANKKQSVRIVYIKFPGKDSAVIHEAQNVIILDGIAKEPGI